MSDVAKIAAARSVDGANRRPKPVDGTLTTAEGKDATKILFDPAAATIRYDGDVLIIPASMASIIFGAIGTDGTFQRLAIDSSGRLQIDIAVQSLSTQPVTLTGDNQVDTQFDSSHVPETAKFAANTSLASGDRHIWSAIYEEGSAATPTVNLDDTDNGVAMTEPIVVTASVLTKILTQPCLSGGAVTCANGAAGDSVHLTYMDYQLPP